MAGFAKRLELVKEEVFEAATKAGRNPGDVRILPVSKTHPVSLLEEAIAAGIREFGENRPQELAEKAGVLGANLEGAAGGTKEGAEGDAPEGKFLAPRWVMIGNLQRNKSKLVVAHAAELQSLDALKTAETLSRLLGDAGRELDVMIEVNTSGEEAKHGVSPAAALDFAGELDALPGLNLVGFMTVAAQLDSVGEAGVRAQFARLRNLRDQAVAEGLRQASALSMGMSGDFALAIAEGSTCVRIGSALFGAREYR